MKRVLVILLFFVVYLSTKSQTHKRHYRQAEVGIFAGGAYYLGDINQRKHFIYSKPAVGAFFRYAMSYRYAFRFGFNYGNIAASDKNSKEPDQLERNLSFRSKLYDFNAIAEFNFVEYRIGNDKHYFSMFIFAGLGGYYFNPQSNMGNGYVNLSELNTEAQSRSYSKLQMNIPFGLGIKWNISDIFGLGIEWGPRKLFTDYLDDVSGIYPIKGGNLYTGSGVAGGMRGNPRSKDWYFFYGMTLQMRLPKLNKECHGMGLGN